MRRSLLATTFGLLAIAASASAAPQTAKPAAPTTATEKADTTKHHKEKEKKAHKEKHKTGTTSTTESTEKKPAPKP